MRRAELLSALALFALAAAPEYVAAQEGGGDGPEYVIGRPALSCLGRVPCGPFRLVDLDLLVAEGGESSGAVRFELDGRAIVGLAVSGEERGAELRSSRLRLLVLDHDDGRLEASARWDGGRWGLRAVGARRAELYGGGWSLRGGFDYRPSADVRISFDGLRDLQDEPPTVFEPRPRTATRVGVLWQQGAGLEISAGLGWARLRSGLGEPLERRSLDVGGAWRSGNWRVGLAARFDDEQGRFDRRDLSARADAELRIDGHLLLATGVRERVELGVAERDRRVHAGLSFFGRRYRFPRGGESAGALEALSDNAWQRGYGFDRVYDLEGLRDLRERVRLARVEALTALSDELLDAQVADRRVEQLAFHWSRRTRPEFAWRISRYEAVVGVPWPLAWPWSRGEARVDFLRLELQQVVSDFGLDTRETTRRVALQARLHRELALRAEYGKRARSPIEIALALDRPDELAVGLRYVFGR